MANVEKYTPDQIIEALNRAGGFVSFAARSLNTTTKTVYDYIHRYPDIKTKLDEIRHTQFDIAESVIVTGMQHKSTKEDLPPSSEDVRIRINSARTFMQYMGGDRFRQQHDIHTTNSFVRLVRGRDEEE